MEPHNTPAPDHTTPPAPNFAPQEVPGSEASNSISDAYADEDRTENQQASPGRGEFGPQGAGHTQGGYGNQYRADEVYGGKITSAPPTRGSYDGGKAELNTATDTSTPTNRSTSAFGTQPETPPEGSTVSPDYANDNDAPQHTGGGYSEDYGKSSLAGGTATNAGANLTGQRNQDDGYLPADSKEEAATPGGFQADPAPVPNQPAVAGSNEHTKSDVARDADESRTGYVRTDGEESEQGSVSTGIGSRGGSYNDPTGPKSDAPGQTGPQNTEPKAQ
ncbi:hypothetical protein MTX78_18335 [Hymenobacter tibetensis]|uniref:Uncharacterized protein n=1 Tax=Hymenobacter tibetensis TaxID=497967 RepID=A0ABY4CV51_9BACT|nr:hypothetical protein [Hymenobacter tibetensis]UOG74068.1 hypothetical protein MTX78_18335 [Hymenobacter tibetensis]